MIGDEGMKLNVEQRRIVELEPSGQMLVKGVAGSGKTTVAIRRINFLKTHYCHEADDQILLVTYNKTLLNYIKFQYERLADSVDEDFQEFFASNANVEIATIDSLMYKAFRDFTRRKRLKLELSMSKPVEHQVMLEAIHEVSKSYPSVKLLSPKNSGFLLDEVEWMASCLVEDVEAYQQLDRIGRASGDSGTPQKLLKNSELREAIYALSIVFTQKMADKGLVTFKQMNLLALRQVHEVKSQQFTHVIIDESQDLTRVQLEFLKALYKEKPHSSLLFVADNTQSIYTHSWLGKGRPYTTIGYDMSGKARALSKNYRTTTEISTAAFDLIEADETIRSNVDFVKPALIDRHGHPPIYRFFTNQVKQLEFLVSEIRQLQNDYDLREICLVGRHNQLLQSLSAGLEGAGIETEILQSQEPNFESDKVKLVTMHSIKGLEFKVIFLVDLNQGVIPNDRYTDVEDQKALDSDERKLLYVGMTRANELLYMSSVKKPSKFIKEIQRKHLRMKKDCALRPFESMSMTEYRFTDQLADFHSREEVVRQWLLRELHDTYQYPYDLMELEFPVQKFSQKGYADVAVMIYSQGEARPFIFAEVKQFGSGIEEGLKQLMTYLEADPRVHYGIVTDGLEVKMIDRNGEEVQDLPRCRPQFLPETKNTKRYMNLKNGKNFVYATSMDDETEIEVRDEEMDIYLQVHEKHAVPLIGNVAAGIPTLATEEYEAKLVLPKDWVYSVKDTFALTVTGDSMINAGIDKGDVVIVHQQNSAQANDIVIAVIDDEATMKKYVPMGNNVLLMPENNNYEPILMRSEDVRINGKVIGVLKK